MTTRDVEELAARLEALGETDAASLLRELGAERERLISDVVERQHELCVWVEQLNTALHPLNVLQSERDSLKAEVERLSAYDVDREDVKSLEDLLQGRNNTIAALTAERDALRDIVDRIENVAAYTQATLPLRGQSIEGKPDWGMAHLGRSESARRQLQQLRDLARAVSQPIDPTDPDHE